MADITIDDLAYGTLHEMAMRAGPFWTSPVVGYVIYADAYSDLLYRKTLDGGATWEAAVNIKTEYILMQDCWADWQTAGDAGTKIHIAYIGSDGDDVRYVYLDTSSDTIGGDVQIEAVQGTGLLGNTSGRSNFHVSIAKTRGGNLAVALHYMDSGNSHFYSFYTSPDGITWTIKASPWEADLDYILLFPGNEADNQDLWATFWDRSTDEISLKTYDNSGNSWSEQLISGSMVESAKYEQMDGTIRLSDGHLIFAAWNLWDDAAADLMVWDINGAASITAKTNVLTDSAGSFLVSVFINQVNDDIYVTYMKGTDVELEVAAFYQKSVNGGANWGGQTVLQADVEDDERWVSAGAIKATWFGKFQPYWFNDDLNDLFTNTDNGIPITLGWTGKIAGVTDPSKIMGVDKANIASVKGVA